MWEGCGIRFDSFPSCSSIACSLRTLIRVGQRISADGRNSQRGVSTLSRRELARNVARELDSAYREKWKPRRSRFAISETCFTRMFLRHSRQDAHAAAEPPESHAGFERNRTGFKNGSTWFVCTKSAVDGRRRCDLSQREFLKNQAGFRAFFAHQDRTNRRD